jgi:hypothetical protein
MIWQAFFSALLRPVLHALSLATSWFGGRKSAQADIKLATVERSLRVVRRAEEIENEVEALDSESLKSRARKWVRGVNDK